MVDGDHVPTIPFGDVVANIGTVPPEQIGEIAAKFGVTVVAQAVLQVTVIGVTHVAVPFAVIVKVTDCPGVNPLTIQCDGETHVPDIIGPPAIE